MNFVLVILRFLLGFPDEGSPACQLAPVREQRGRYARQTERDAWVVWVPVIGWLTLRTPTCSSRHARRYRTRSPSGTPRGRNRAVHVMRT